MAEAPVSVVLEQLASIIHQPVDETIRLVVGVDEEIKNLTNHFQTIQAVLIDAEKKQVQDNAVRVWLDKLKDISYDVDDVLDEWNTVIQKLRIEKVEDASKPLKNVCSLTSYYQCCCRRIIFRYDIADKIRNLESRLRSISTDKDMFQPRLITNGREELEPPITTSISDLTKVYGRDENEKTIVENLLSQSQILSVISIVGMGGIGKTTLARLAFNNKKVETHFDKRIWVYVSKPFDQMRIAKAILESLINASPNFNELENVLQNIRHHIKGKKFLLVLDDVWTDNPRDWEQLKKTLNCGSPESKILVTSCKKSVANAIETTNNILLRTLSENDCWSLFSEIAFSRSSNEEYENLIEIGKKIVQKCKGLPFAIKNLAELLRFERNIEEWQNVLDSEMWALNDKIFLPLYLSYFDLPSKLKKCFSYCAIFPKDYRIEKKELIMLWMAQDYLKDEQNKDMELVGEEYFEILVMRFFFEDFEKDDLSNIKSFKMHDIVHVCAQFLTQNECFTIEVNGSGDSKSELLRKTFRHSMIMGEFGSPLLSPIWNQKSLRSLVVKSREITAETILSKLCNELICLRTLDLREQSIKEIPKGIKDLIHLRYINLSNNNLLRELPEDLCELNNLQILNVSRCKHLQKLPLRIGKLINLRHLEIWESSISYMPKSFERLTSLRTLNNFVASNSGFGSKVCPFECLKNFNHLREIWIKSMDKVTDVGIVKEAELNNKKNLRILYLEFEESMNENNENVLEAVELPPNLEQLSIKNYEGHTLLFPCWTMPLISLRWLRLDGCINCKNLPPLGKLPSLEILYIHKFKSVKRVGNEFFEAGNDVTLSSSFIVAFRKLKSLSFSKMEEWEEWNHKGKEWNYNFTKTSEVKFMPSLQTLEIDDCPQLKSFPSELRYRTTLKTKIYKCPHLESTLRRIEQA